MSTTLRKKCRNPDSGLTRNAAWSPFLYLNRVPDSFPSASKSQQVPQLMTNSSSVKLVRTHQSSSTSVIIRCATLYQLNDVIASAISLINLARTNEEPELSYMLREASPKPRTLCFEVRSVKQDRHRRSCRRARFKGPSLPIIGCNVEGTAQSRCERD
jgi:hypothetical protein